VYKVLTNIIDNAISKSSLRFNFHHHNHLPRKADYRQYHDSFASRPQARRCCWKSQDILYEQRRSPTKVWQLMVEAGSQNMEAGLLAEVDSQNMEVGLLAEVDSQNMEVGLLAEVDSVELLAEVGSQNTGVELLVELHNRNTGVEL